MLFLLLISSIHKKKSDYDSEGYNTIWFAYHQQLLGSQFKADVDDNDDEGVMNT